MQKYKVFISRKFWIFAWILGLLILGVIAFCFKENRLVVIPGNYQTFVRSDSLEEGFSRASLSLMDSTYRLDFLLRSGAPTPYAGVGFSFLSPTQILKEEFIDFSKYDSLRVILATDRMPKVTLRLSVHDPKWTKPNEVFSARPLDLVIGADRKYAEYRVSLSDFAVPERWFDQMGIEVLDEWRYLDRGMRLEVLSATGALLGIPDALEVKELELFGVNRDFLLTLGWISIVLTIICAFGAFKKEKGVT